MEVKIEKLDYFGRGVAHINNKVCFINNALKDERVDIEITNVNKKYDEGRVLRIIEASPNRVEVSCPYYKECGGCNLLHLASEIEDNYKRDKVCELISRIAYLDSNLVEDTKSYKKIHYRNKVIFHVIDKKLGFYKEKSNVLIEIDSCKLLREEINDLIPTLKVLVENSNNEINEIMVRVGNNDTKNKIMVSIKGRVDDFLNIKDIVDVLIINNKKVTISDKLLTSIGPNRFYVSDKSFFQINDSVTSKLYDEVLEFCKNNKVSNVLDLYCGTGTISIYISDYVDYVLGIDSQESSIINANDNKLLNNKDNVTFICSKVEDYIDKIKDKFDLIVVDPPRSGLDKKTLNYLMELNPKNIIYISCDPATLSRDLKELNTTYEVVSIKPYNMFVHTYHVETISVLERK